ncbi:MULTISPECIES: glycosyltransferase [Pseudoalteromonas]|uniref:glycosyltransferase n=1 Tax=Pseudoalteromonas TaxID=53246 RepID=UPI0002F7F523|nr:MULTISPECIES: glycosyltransferase [Pseudoalteromonas]MDP4489761.1 glycosyltransferase [Pseudoalteromonas piscicida]
MKVKHILLTRFSYRQNPDDIKKQTADVFVRHDDVLSPHLLDNRFALFETACLPNVLAQTNQDFEWVIIIDPDLPEKYLTRLKALISVRADRTHLHVFRRDELGGLDWLEQHIPSDTDYVLTTNVDDDDIISIDYMERLQSHVKALGDKAPSIKFLGIKSTYQWNIFSSNKYPFGTYSPWHRANIFKSTGYSMLCKLSSRRMTVYSLHHASGDVWFAQGNEKSMDEAARAIREVPPEQDNYVNFAFVSNFQKRIEKTLDGKGDDWKTAPHSELMHDFSKEGAMAIHLNHFVNDQATRLFEYKQCTKPVVKNQFFPNKVNINWVSFEEHKGLFELSSALYSKLLAEIKSHSKKLNIGWLGRQCMSIAMTIKLRWWFLRH